MIEINKIYNMDCLVGLKLLDTESIDLVITSPPYDNLRDYNGYSFSFELIAQELYRVIKQGGIIVWVVGDATVDGGETLTSFKQALYFQSIGFKIHDVMIYEKHNPVPNTGNGVRYQQCFEYMFIISKGKPKTVNLIKEPRKNSCNDKRTERIMHRQRNSDGRFGKKHRYVFNDIVTRKNIWTYKVGLYNSTSDKIAFNHPAIFPEQLCIDHILSWSNEGELVLDIFMGSGTTAKASILTNRNYIGFEISKEYCNIADKRINETQFMLKSGNYAKYKDEIKKCNNKKLF
jgi:site-specific DNA-methyltransferase (adenine-specific)